MEENQIEFAENLAEASRNLGIERSRVAMEKQTDPSFNGKQCIDCLEPIALQRIAMLRIRCTSCESDREKQALRFRH